ncbi:hypothetical protein ACOCJ4_03255 [Knoellia sp. CPCC 206435]|uniref:hypothetical protein n=1 Tax=Knoellia terrae TaxID=3404797 RepID=UPI003B43432E
MSHIPVRLRRIAGALALVHVVLIFVGLALQQGPLFADGAGGIEESYVQGNLTRSFSGGLLEGFGFVLLVPVLVMLARCFGSRTEAGRWAAQTGLACGLAYVAVVFAVGFPAGAAAMYGAQNGLDTDTAFAINNIRLFAHFLSAFLLAGATAGVALAAIADRIHTRWVGGFGVLTAAALLVSPPLTSVGWQDIGTMVWLVWFVGVAVQLLRGGSAATESAGSTPGTVLVGHP